MPKIDLSSKKTQVGFTLIELLIVVAIITIVVAIGAVSYSGAQRQARNVKRASDLQLIASALERYYADHDFYPETNTVGYTPAQVQEFGNSTKDTSRCLFGGSIASSVLPNPPSWTCTQRAAPSNQPILPPYNVYLGDGDLNNLPQEPLSPWPHWYYYASDGQTYILISSCYEGTPPADHKFGNTNPYWTEVTTAAVCSGSSWSNQYFVSQPTTR